MFERYVQMLVIVPCLLLAGCRTAPKESTGDNVPPVSTSLRVSEILGSTPPPTPRALAPAADDQGKALVDFSHTNEEQLPSPKEVVPDKVETDSSPARPQSAVNLRPPALEPGDVPLPINLAAALQLSDARPLIVAAAQASVQVAEAQLQKAQVLWLPSLTIGSDYLRHDGPGPDVINGVPIPPNKQLNQNVNFLYSGIGLINQNTQTTDMIFEPLAARQVLRAAKADVQTAKNDALLQTAEAYYRVHQFRGRYTGAIDVVNRGISLVDRIEKLSDDLVPKVEVDRARRQLEHLKQEAASDLEAYRVASADLTQVLRLDPRVVVVPLEHDHLQLTLIDPAKPLDELIPIGLSHRPEIAAQAALVQAAIYRIRQETLRPWLPTLYLNGFQTPHESIQMGVFGIGHGNSMNLWGLRDDVTLQITWELQNFGMGNLALTRRRRAQQSNVTIGLARAQDRVAADVTEALARIKSAGERVGQADKSLREAIITFDGNYEGLRQTTRLGKLLVLAYRPQEVVIALEHLKTAYDEYYSTVAEYNRAQFGMFHALGYPAAEIALAYPPEEAAPVDTGRPDYLPPVGTGPPPPTR